jgi:hypothetical protein
MSIISKTEFGFLFWCTACGNCHGVWIHKPNEMTKAQWTWNGSMDKPSFSPSFVIKEIRNNKPYVCHIVVKDGEIHYLDDCTHELKGKVVPLSEFWS